MTINGRIQTISFLIILLGIAVVCTVMILPFFNILALAIILAILFQPVFGRYLKMVPSRAWASLFTVLTMLVIVSIPLLLFGRLIFNELYDLYNQYRSGELVLNRNELIQSLPVPIQATIENASQDINSIVGRVTENAFSTVSSILSNVAAFAIGVIILLFLLYYFLKDGEKMKLVFMDLSPIGVEKEHKLFNRIVTAVRGVVLGSFLIALLQGSVATIGFYIFGVPNPVIWGLVTVLTALVPTIGTALSLVPAVLYLAITGHMPEAFGLAIWSMVAVGLVDNFLSPRLIGSQTQLHPVLVLLSVLGGLELFGILGFLLGPIVMAIFVALVEMYRTDFKAYIHEA